MPSGVWSIEDYLKLPAYDGETWEQPPAAFLCHATPEWVCHGWAVVGGYDLLGLRLLLMQRNITDFELPESRIPLFDSHTETAEHGVRNIKRPTKAAREAMDRLKRKHPRLKDG